MGKWLDFDTTAALYAFSKLLMDQKKKMRTVFLLCLGT